MFGEVFGEFLQAVHLKREMCQIGLALHGFAAWEKADLDQFLALGCLEEDQFRTARGFVAFDLRESEDVTIELHRAFEVVHPVPRVQNFSGQTHGCRLAGS